MVTKIQKWGNSLGLRIPKSFALEVRVKPGSQVDLAVDNGSLVIRPLKPGKHSLDALLAKMNSANLHAEADWGGPAGKESF